MTGGLRYETTMSLAAETLLLSIDPASEGGPRHGTKFLGWSEDKAPEECLMEQLRA